MTPNAGRKQDMSISKDDCWLWAGEGDSTGHGRIHVGYDRRLKRNISEQVYRIMYENMVGEIPAGMELDHLCENPPCINPAHLEPTTHRENTLRYYRRRTHCRNGHDYVKHGRIIHKKSNVSKSNPTGESRECILCHPEKTKRLALPPQYTQS